MTDIVERLRRITALEFKDMSIPTDVAEAADEIERLRKNSRLYWDSFQKSANEIEWLREDLKHSDEVRQSALQSLFARECEIERLCVALGKIADAYIPGIVGDEYTKKQVLVAHHTVLVDIAREALWRNDGGGMDSLLGNPRSFDDSKKVGDE